MKSDLSLEDRHPLNRILVMRGWSGECFLRKVSAKHRELGYGDIGCRKEKISRWTRPVKPQIPGESTRLAIAAVLGIRTREVITGTWPHWLLVDLEDGGAAWESPWTQAGTLDALNEPRKSGMERRGFLTAGAGTVASVIHQWVIATPSPALTRAGRRIGLAVADRFDSRLNDLRHLDDDLGADHVYDVAVAEVRLIARLLRNGSYSEPTGRRLYGCAAEASRLAGWCAYDNRDIAAAETHFAASLRASASVGDHTAGGIAAAFWANVRYGSANPDPRSALQLIEGALLRRDRITSPRVLAMLYIRRARSHSLVGEELAAYRAIDDALDVYGQAGPVTDDLPSAYWINSGEILQAAASSALSLGDPSRALGYFTAAVTHDDPYQVNAEPRGTAIYLCRQASAHLALGQPDGAAEVARQAVDLMGGVSSARGSGTLHDLRASFAVHRGIPAVREFLELTDDPTAGTAP